MVKEVLFVIAMLGIAAEIVVTNSLLCNVLVGLVSFSEGKTVMIWNWKYKEVFTGKLSWTDSVLVLALVGNDFVIFSLRYTLLHVLEFDSTRKRMSVIVKTSEGKKNESKG